MQKAEKEQKATNKISLKCVRSHVYNINFDWILNGLKAVCKQNNMSSEPDLSFV